MEVRNDCTQVTSSSTTFIKIIHHRIFWNKVFFAISKLCSKYSMLRTMLQIKENVDIKYPKLIAFWKTRDIKPNKAKTFSREEVNEFLLEAPDDIYSLMKTKRDVVSCHSSKYKLNQSILNKMTEFADIQKLVELFNPTVNENSDDSDDEREKHTKATTKAVNVQNSGETAASSHKKVNPYSKFKTDGKKQMEAFDPETEDFLYQELEHKTESDWKKSPKWDITYKQQVTASDVFLQMGFKNPTTASCEDMIIAIHLPGESYQNIDLKIHKKSLTLVSPRFYLDVPLPHPVDPQKGNAKWDNASEKLLVTLMMDRELDIVNF